MELHDRTILHTPPLTQWVEDDCHFFLDGAGPNWIATDDRGAQLIEWIDGTTDVGTLIERYRVATGMEGAKSWLHIHDFMQGLLRQRLVGPEPLAYPTYNGRVAHLRLDRLEDCWLHLNDECNLACRHCLVSSSPKGGTGLPPDVVRRLVDEALRLGVTRFYFTGGEPFLRPDLPDLLHHIATQSDAECICLTNALRIDADRLQALRALPRDRCRFQISLDGATPATNDRWRGQGTFHAILEGVHLLSRAGFACALTTVVTPNNIMELPQMPPCARECGATSMHLMWPHRRGRMREGFPDPQSLIPILDEVRTATTRADIAFDNWDSMALRVNGLAFLKYDLSNAGWGSCCIGPDGHLYPSPALAKEPRFDAGDVVQHGLAKVWKESPLLHQLRSLSLLDISPSPQPSPQRGREMSSDPFRFITGGGDMDQILIAGGAGDPHYPLYVHLAKRIMRDLAERGRAVHNTRSGYTPPPIYHAMGRGAIPSGTFTALPGPETITLGTLHSNCVLSFDVEKPRKVVQHFYGGAAEQPQVDLCCPVKYDAAETAHIPTEVLDRFYGCGSPSTLAALQPGETYCDLGSGGGIDCFIAAKKVGATGRVIGIDMTDPMLEVANRNKALVAQALGFDCVEFRKGYLEQIPVEDGSVHCLTSNCVINLSPDKPAVFREMWRVLAQQGRIVIADIVADCPTPPSLQANPHLWGECIAGALTEAQCCADLERAGFYGLQILRKTFWKSVEGYHFFSITVRGYKFAKEPSCRFIGQRAIYLGPAKAFVDDEGHHFPRNVAVAVCTDTAAKLRTEPYAPMFSVFDSGVTPDQQIYACDPMKGCC